MKKYIKPIAEAITVETNAQTMVSVSNGYTTDPQLGQRRKGVVFVDDDYDDED